MFPLTVFFVNIWINEMGLNAFPGRLTLLVASIEPLCCSLDLEDWLGMLFG